MWLPPLTFFSGLSTGLQLFFLICCSRSNFMVTSSMESCNRSQKPARSWEVGRGMALGSCQGRKHTLGEELHVGSLGVFHIISIAALTPNSHCVQRTQAVVLQLGATRCPRQTHQRMHEGQFGFFSVETRNNNLEMETNLNLYLNLNVYRNLNEWNNNHHLSALSFCHLIHDTKSNLLSRSDSSLQALWSHEILFQYLDFFRSFSSSFFCEVCALYVVPSAPHVQVQFCF